VTLLILTQVSADVAAIFVVALIAGVSSIIPLKIIRLGEYARARAFTQPRVSRRAGRQLAKLKPTKKNGRAPS
jgi:hypothetical protein